MLPVRKHLRAFALAGTLLVVGGCADLPSTAGAATRLELLASHRGPSLSVEGGVPVAAAVIGPRGGELATASGHRIVFPAGAVARPTEIRMRDDGVYSGVRLEPHGLEFPAGRGPELTLRVPSEGANGYDFLRVVYVDDDGAVLEVLQTQQGAEAVTAHLRHFSGYMIGGGRQEP